MYAYERDGVGAVPSSVGLAGVDASDGDAMPECQALYAANAAALA